LGGARAQKQTNGLIQKDFRYAVQLASPKAARDTDALYNERKECYSRVAELS
jgi:hypothetical protein